MSELIPDLHRLGFKVEGEDLRSLQLRVRRLLGRPNAGFPGIGRERDRPNSGSKPIALRKGHHTDLMNTKYSLSGTYLNDIAFMSMKSQPAYDACYITRPITATETVTACPRPTSYILLRILLTID